MTESQNMEIYISYAIKDENDAIELMKRLGPLQRDFGFHFWWRGKITAGKVFKEEMIEHLRKSFIYVALCSSDYFVSEECFSERVAALRLNKKIIAINFRASALEYSDLKNADLITPSLEKHIRKYSDIDEAWGKAVEDILNYVKSFQIGDEKE
jgi:hypothetical protein